MSYTLFVVADCLACERVIHALEQSKIEINIRDRSEASGGFAGKVLIVPALFLGERLVAYGEEIVPKISKPVAVE